MGGVGAGYGVKDLLDLTVAHHDIVAVVRAGAGGGASVFVGPSEGDVEGVIVAFTNVTAFNNRASGW